MCHRQNGLLNLVCEENAIVKWNIILNTSMPLYFKVPRYSCTLKYRYNFEDLDGRRARAESESKAEPLV